MSNVYALDLDEELLAHLPLQESWITLQGEGFTAELIEDPEIREVYEWQRSHQREHKRIATATVLAEEFDLDLVEPETSIGDLIDRIRTRYMKNQGRDRIREIVSVTRDGDPLEVPGLLMRQGRELNHLLAKRGEVFGTGDLDRAMHRYDFKEAQGPGASFGYDELDRHYYGMRGLNFLIAYKKSFKTWQMIQSVASNVEQGKCVWLYSLELPAEETDMRLRFLVAEIPWWKWVHNKITIEDRKRLSEAADVLDGCGIYKIVKPPQGQRGAHEMTHTARDAGADVVLFDQLQYIENDNGKSLGRLNDTGEYFGVLDDLRNLSDDGPIYVAHQFGRGAMGAEEMPDIAMAKGSSAIEEVCTLALGMFANKAMRQSGKLEIGTLIARNAAAFTSWEMDVDLTRTTRFTITRRLEEE